MDIHEIELVRSELTEQIKLIRQREEQIDALQVLADMRKLPFSVLDNANIVYSFGSEYIEGIVDTNMSDYLGFTDRGDNIFRERFIVPIKDSCNRIAGLSGYDKDSEIKYLFSNTLYFNKNNIFYNYNEINDIYKRDTVIIVEGFMDSLRLTSLNLTYNLGCMGVWLDEYKLEIVNRIEKKIILGDNDIAGQKAQKYWLKNLTGKVAHVHIKPTVVEEEVFDINEEGDKVYCTKETKIKDVDDYVRVYGDKGAEKVKKLVKKIEKEMSTPFFKKKDYYL